MKWTPVESQWPSFDVLVLAFGDNGIRTMRLRYINATGYWFSDPENNTQDNTITHWMPLPEPPPVTI